MIRLPRLSGRRPRSLVDDQSAIVLRGGRVAGEDFSGRHLRQFSPEGVYFERCSFNDVVIDSASLGAGVRDSHYVDCTFDGARLRMFSPGYARLERCSFRNVRIVDFFCMGVELVDCTFSGTVKNGCIRGLVPDEHVASLGRRRNEVTGNDFSGLRLINFDFWGGVDLTAQKLPSGPDYLYIADYPAAVRRAREAMLSEPDLEFRREAFIYIGIMEMSVASGQRQQLFPVKDYNPRQHPAIHRLFEIMREE